MRADPFCIAVHVTGKVLGTDWYECELDGKTVYMSDDWLDPELPQVKNRARVFVSKAQWCMVVLPPMHAWRL